MTYWEPSKDMLWQNDANCAQPKYRELAEHFYSNDEQKKSLAKGLCGQCPVRTDCLKWALENAQIWGIWGGKDHKDIRRVLSVNVDNMETRYARFPNCLNCGAATRFLKTRIAENPDGGRWTTVRLVECLQCCFVWRSRTSFNAVNAYNKLVEEKKPKFLKDSGLDEKNIPEAFYKELEDTNTGIEPEDDEEF